MDSRLVRAIRGEDIDRVRELLAAGVKVDPWFPAADIERPSYLYEAVASGNLVIANLLLSYGAPTGRSWQWHIPLHLAIKKGDFQMFRLLLNRGADPRVVDRFREGSLYHAAKAGQTLMVKMLLNRGLDPNFRNVFGETPIYVAANPAIFQLLRSAGARLDDKDFLTALDRAIGEDRPGVVALLLEAGAPVDAPPYGGYGGYILHQAIINSSYETFRLLLEHGADPEVRDVMDNTLLHNAAAFGDPEVVGLLLETTADLESRNKDGETPLHKAAEEGNSPALRLLLEHGADLEVRNRSGGTPLHSAIMRSNPNAVRLLLEYGAEIQNRAPKGDTPLHVAVKHFRKLPWQSKDVSKELAVVQTLLEHGADPNLMNEKGQTPLDLAMKIGNDALIWMLMMEPW